jgi:hypothetical protein
MGWRSPQRTYRQCRYCHFSYAVRKDGMIRKHTRQSWYNEDGEPVNFFRRIPCVGGGRKPQGQKERGGDESTKQVRRMQRNLGRLQRERGGDE